MSNAHLVSRFVGSLWPGPPRAANGAWALGWLLPEEADLWNRMSNQDRRHSVAVAKAVVEAMGEPVDRPVVAAALLHDVGKIDSSLGTFLRIVATLSAKIAGRETAELWVGSTGVTRRIGLYLKHPEIGADLLAMAGSDPLTVSWAREHHLPPEDWTIAVEVAEVLSAADND